MVHLIVCQPFYYIQAPASFKIECVLQEVEAPHGGGYLMLGDDVIISHCQLAAFDPKKAGDKSFLTRKHD